MTCPTCGRETALAHGRCTACGRRLAESAVLTETLTPPPQIRSGGEDETRLPRPLEADLTIAAVNSVPDGDLTQPALPPAIDPSQTSTAAPGSTVSSSRKGSKHGPLEPGEPFGPRYHLIRLLGMGGMGAVYQAWDEELGVAVALKVIRPEIAADPEAARDIERRFKRELLLARQVTHKNVVRIHDLGEIDGIKYITMPYLDGSDLATILKQETRLPLPRALRIARGIVAGLVPAHDAGVVHRDLKPANIMVGPDDQPTIMDFGIARSSGGPGKDAAVKGGGARELSPGSALLAGSTMAGSIVGTVEYMAPEQARSQSVDQRADIYAFGLILYDMLIGGRRSERATSAIAELQGRMEQRPPAPRTLDPNIPATIDEIVSRCLDPDPDKRFQTSAELQSALGMLDDDGKRLPMIRRLTRRGVAAAAVLVLILLGGTFYTAKWMTAPPVEPDPVTVVIADFQNSTSDPTFDNTLAQTVTRALQSASFITAFDSVGARQEFSAVPEKFDGVAARQLAVKEGLGVVLAGSIAPRGSGYEIAMQATHPMTGDVITTVQQRAASKDQVLDALTGMVTSVRRAFGDETSDAAQELAMRPLSTTSLEVASYYAAGSEATSRGAIEEAIKNYARAVELDPKFGLGYQALAVQSANLGRLQDAEKYAKEALRYLDGMTEREKFQTRGNYYARTGDYRACVKEYSELIAGYPADVLAHNQRALCLVNLRDMRGAVDAIRQAVKILPNQVFYRINLALLLAHSGDFTAAELEARSIQARVAGEPSLQDLAARALNPLVFSQIGQGRIRDAAETYRKLTTMDAWGRSFGATGLGDLAVYEGRFTEAVRLFEQGAAADLAAKNPDLAAMKFASAGYAQLARGQKRAAAAAADRALQNSSWTPIQFLAARIFVETGDIARARALAKEFLSQVAAEPRAYGTIIEGGIALKNGNPREAIKILTEANEILDTWLGHFDLGRAYFELEAYPQADSEFDRCLQRRGEALALFFEDPTYGHLPIVYYYLGRVREEMKTAAFADSYREYLRIRGQSKEDPLLADVRRRAGQ